MVVERSVSKDVGTALQSSGGSGSCLPLAGACFDVTQKLIFGAGAVCLHTAAGLQQEPPASSGTGSAIAAWEPQGWSRCESLGLGFLLTASENTNAVNFFGKC